MKRWPIILRVEPIIGSSSEEVVEAMKKLAYENGVLVECQWNDYTVLANPAGDVSRYRTPEWHK